MSSMAMAEGIVEVAMKLGTGKNSVLGGSKAMGTMESKGFGFPCRDPVCRFRGLRQTG